MYSLKYYCISSSISNSLCSVFTVKFETQKFVEEELSNITMPEMKGKEGRFQYTITEYKYYILYIWCNALIQNIQYMYKYFFSGLLTVWR